MSEKSESEKFISWPVRNRRVKASFFDDVAGDEEALREEVGRLFGSADVFEVEACVIDGLGCKAEKLRSGRELEEFLNKNENGSGAKDPSASIFFLHQQHSRARFSISEKAAVALLHGLNVFPSFLKILSSFGVEDGPRAQGKTGFYEETTKNKEGNLTFETTYTLKHVEPKPGSELPFSIRQMGVYQHFSTHNRKSSYILLQNSLKVRRNIATFAKNGEGAMLPDHWKNIHEVHLATLSSNWSAYLKLLAVKIAEIEDAVRFTRRDNTHRITFKILQQLSKYIDILIRLDHALDLNIVVLAKLSQTALRRQEIDDQAVRHQYEEFQASIRTTVTEHEFLIKHVNLVRTCADEMAVLLRDTITLADSDGMLTLTQRTIQEARTMKTITLIALIYLPASFTAAFLSMDIIHVSSLQGRMKLTVKDDIWFWLAITLPLMTITIVGWWGWELVVRRRARVKSMERMQNEKIKGV